MKQKICISDDEDDVFQSPVKSKQVLEKADTTPSTKKANGARKVQ